MEKIEQSIDKLIYLIRDQKVMMDEDLSRLYQVQTKVLVQAVKRNLKRFPPDFMFQLSAQEYSVLRSQFVTSSGRIGRRTRPYAFTEHGVAMLSSVLHSERAVDVNIAIIRTFIKMRQMISTDKDLAHKLDLLERRYDAQFKVVFNSIRKLIEAKPEDLTKSLSSKHKIGFGNR